jgi:hypothetical protein
MSVSTVSTKTAL